MRAWMVFQAATVLSAARARSKWDERCVLSTAGTTVHTAPLKITNPRELLQERNRGSHARSPSTDEQGRGDE
jgi:hypothetical protein